MFATSPFSTVIATLAMFIWALNGVLNQYRLVRYFQLEGYDGKRFWRVLARQSRERNYIGLSIIITFVLFFAGSLPLSVSDAGTSLISQLDLIASIIALIAVLTDFFLRP